MSRLRRMHPANYTSENLCRALGLGPFVPALAADEREVLRLLLAPSFQPELCLTLRRSATRARIDVVAARSQIWHQGGLAPAPVATHAGGGDIDPAAFDALLPAWHAATRPRPSDKFVILDGVRAHAARRTPDGTAELQAKLGEHAAFERFVDAALAAAWHAVAEPRVRNAIADLSGRDLPHAEVPPDKPAFMTAVLGAGDEAVALLEALARLHAR